MICSLNNSYAANYFINPARTNVSFVIERFKSPATTGGFYNVEGQLQYDASLKTGDISLIIPINSLSTGNQGFNNYLTGPKFFDIEKFPLAYFKSTHWYFNKDKISPQVIRVDGNLTLHGETHPISLTAIKFNCYSTPIIAKDICAGNFTATIDRTKWNINKYVLFGMTKNLNLNIQVEATEQ